MTIELPKPTEAKARGITLHISLPIFGNPKKRPKPQKSWAGLKAGDVLEFDAVRHAVLKCDSQGVWLEGSVRVDDRGWKGLGWRKVPKRELK